MKSIKVEHHLLAMFPVLLAPDDCFEVDLAPPNDGKSSVMSGTLSTVWYSSSGRMPCPWPRWWLVGLLANETSMPTWRLSLLSTLLNLCLSSLCALRSNSVRKACVNCSSIREDQFYIKYYLRLPLDGDCSWKIAKIGVLKFWNFPWKKYRQNERSSVLGSLSVNKVSQDFSWFFLCKIRLFVIF